MKPQGIGMFYQTAVAKISPTRSPNAPKKQSLAWLQLASRSLLMSLALVVGSTVAAEDSMQDAADMAEVFVYGRESKNEALLKEISDPKQYEAMAEQRKEKNSKLNENVEVDKVENYRNRR